MKTEVIEVQVLFGENTNTFFFKSFQKNDNDYQLLGMNGIDGINMTVPYNDCYIVPSNEKIKNVVQEVSSFINNYGVDLNGFCDRMNLEHRTLQNTFTKLCLTWIEYTSNDEYRYDGRNESSKIICSKLLELWEIEMAKDGWTNQTLTLMSKPSGHIGMV